MLHAVRVLVARHCLKVEVNSGKHNPHVLAGIGGDLRVLAYKSIDLSNEQEGNTNAQEHQSVQIVLSVQVDSAHAEVFCTKGRSYKRRERESEGRAHRYGDKAQGQTSKSEASKLRFSKMATVRGVDNHVHWMENHAYNRLPSQFQYLGDLFLHGGRFLRHLV